MEPKHPLTEEMIAKSIFSHILNLPVTGKVQEALQQAASAIYSLHEAEVKALKEKVMKLASVFDHANDNLQDKIEQLQAENTRLREALKKYEKKDETDWKDRTYG